MFYMVDEVIYIPRIITPRRFIAASRRFYITNGTLRDIRALPTRKFLYKTLIAVLDTWLTPGPTLCSNIGLKKNSTRNNIVGYEG